jgi:formylglycine-generating enzyme required for sulfatase activity
MAAQQAGLSALGPDRHIRHAMNMRFLFLACITVASAVLTFSASPQERPPRVALVIGNASYPDASTPLSTTIRDARTLAEEFRRSDFDVDLKENLGKEEMRVAIDAFMNKIRSGMSALFYFNGFGIQVGRQTYLIPVNAQIWTEAEVRRDGVSIDATLAEMNRRGAKVKIVIIDAARRNPFERRFRTSAAGLAAVDAPEGTLAMYSAAPGKVLNDGTGTNSLFVSELIKELRVPNLTAEEVFNRARIGVSRASNNEQVPWVASSLIDEFYFGATRPTQSSAPAPTPAPAPAPAPTQTDSPAPPPAPAPPTQATNPAPSPAPAPVPAPPPPPTQASTPPAPPPPEPSGQASAKPGDTFRDCADCGEVVVVPAGSFQMGSASEFENPVHNVKIEKPFAIGRHEVTFDEWDQCVEEGGCKHRPDDRDWGRGDRPVINVSWLDAKAFVAWLSQKTGKTYRLPSEAEWEYAARGGASTPYWWGRDVGARQANCRECKADNPQQTLPVGSFKPNPFGLFDTAGNAAEWVEDCWNDNYRGAPVNGTAWQTGQCRLRVLRGGAYDSQARYLRSQSRFRYDSDVRFSANGFRVLRELQ